MKDHIYIEVLRRLLCGTSAEELKDSVKFLKKLTRQMKVPNDISMSFLQKFSNQRQFDLYCNLIGKHIVEKNPFPEEIQNQLNDLKKTDEINPKTPQLIADGIRAVFEKTPDLNNDKRFTYTIAAYLFNLSRAVFSQFSPYIHDKNPDVEAIITEVTDNLVKLFNERDKLKQIAEEIEIDDDSSEETQPDETTAATPNTAAESASAVESNDKPADDKENPVKPISPEPVSEPFDTEPIVEDERLVKARAILEKVDFSKINDTSVEIKRTNPGVNRRNVVTGLLYVINNSYYNFYPICRWKNGIPTKISRESALALYPEKCNFVFGDTKNLNRSQRLLLKNGVLLNLQFNDEDLDDNPVENLSKKSLDIVPLFNEDKVKLACYDDRENSYWKAYYVVEPADKDHVSFDRRMPVKVDTLSYIRPELSGLIGQPVLVRHNNKYYGPLKLLSDNSKNLYVTPMNGLNDGFTEYYQADFRGEGTPLFDVDTLSFLVNLDIYFINPKLTKKYKEDTLSNDTLIHEIVKKLPDNTDFSGAVTDWLETYLESGELQQSPLITKNRAVRLLQSLTTSIAEHKEIDEFVEILDKVLLVTAADSRGLFDIIYKKAMEDPELIRKLPSHKMAFEKLEEMKRELEDIKKETDVENVKKREQEIKLAKTRAILDLEKKIETLQIRLADYTNLDQLLQVIAQKTEEKQKLDKQLEQNRKEFARLKDERKAFNTQLQEFDKKIKETATNVANLAFDGEVTAKILEAANRWDNHQNEKRYESRIAFLRSLNKSDLKGRELNTVLCDYLKNFRQYDPNEFTNLFVCVAQNFLTVLSGKPGSGKTSLCNLLTSALGLNTIAKDPETTERWKDRNLANRYIPVSVERGWNSKRDLIGYFNPLTHSFESPDPHRLECFRELDAEAKADFNELPYFVLLDEANLSSMEYYFADFMNICDERNELSYISLGGNLSYRIPDTLRFLATINNDHTTESLSPRLIDRSWIITLPKAKSLDQFSSGTGNQVEQPLPINWQNFLTTFGVQANQDLSVGLKSLTKEAVDRFEELGVQLSPRTLRSIHNYLGTASKVMKGDSELIAFDFAVAQKLLPTINGVGEEYRDKLLTLDEWLENSSLKKSAALLKEITERGTANMDYFGFF